MQPFFRPSYRQGAIGWVPEQVFTLNNFGGGLNNVEPEGVINDNEMTDTKNMRFVSESLMEKRYGLDEVDNVKFPPIVKTVIDPDTEVEEEVPQPITWLDKFYALDGTISFVRATDNELYVGETKICDVEGTVCGVNYIGKYYFVDGKSIRVYDGKEYYKIVKEPFDYLSEDLAATDTVLKMENIPEQTIVGDKVFFLSTIISYGATAPAHVVKNITAIDREAKTVTIDTSVGKIVQKEVDTKKSPIYFYEPRNETDHIFGEEKWDKDTHLASYYPCVIELANGYAGNSYIPDSPVVITAHANRLFVAGDDKSPNGVFMSGYTAIAPQPLYFPSGSSISVKPNGQGVIDLIVFDNALIIGRHEDMFVLYGSSVSADSNDSFYLKQMDVSTGLMNSNCGALLNNFYIYLGYDGIFYKLNTPTTFVEYLMTRPLSQKCDIYSKPFSIPKNSKVKTSAVAYRNEVLININEDLTVVYNFSNMGYTYYTDWGSSCLYTDTGLLYIGTNEGKFAKYCDEEELYVDFDKPISSILKTKRFDFDSSASFKYFKKYMMTSQTFPELSMFEVDVDIDYSNPFKTSLNSNKSMFGLSKFGDRFNNRDVVKSRYIDLDYRGRTIQFIIYNDLCYEGSEGETIGVPFMLFDINLLYSNRDVR